jgi:hypothetical protein
MLVCVLGGVYTDVEKTMIERLSGRDVLSFISNQHVGPDMEVELFMLRRAPSSPVGVPELAPAAASAFRRA